MDLDSAIKIVTAELNKGLVDTDKEQGLSIVVDRRHTITKSYGWVFFYQSAKFLETGDVRHMLVGNAPIIYNKFEGTINYTGTADHVEHYIEEYEKNLF